MWLLFAVGSAFFSGITAILAKCGVRKTDSTVATAVRTVVVLLFSWLVVLIAGSKDEISSLSAKTVVFLILSGIATGASWLCYFKALQTGDINKVVPIDKFSTVLTMLLAMIFLNEGMSLLSAAAIVLISAGTFLMIQKQNTDFNRSDKNDKSWLIYAVLSAVFAALTSILGKVGIENVESNLGTAIRTCVVLVMAWLMVFITGKTGEVRKIPRKDLLFICLSGFATGGAWLCYYKALQDGPASVVVPVDKLSILITILFSYIVFKEKLSKISFRSFTHSGWHNMHGYSCYVSSVSCCIIISQDKVYDGFFYL